MRRLQPLAAGIVILSAAMSSGAQAKLEPLASGATPNAFFAAAAKQVRRGLYPRAYIGEQPYWTLIGTDGGGRGGLISEDGAIELAKGGASIEPFVIEDGRLVTWADVTLAQSLQDGYLPIPTVTWRGPGWDLRVTAFAIGDARQSQLVGRYEIRNLTDQPRTLTLALAIRPFQVNGPEQFLNTKGGFSPIETLAFDGGRVVVNGQTAVWPLGRPDRFEATALEAGFAPALLLSSKGAAASARDDHGTASGALIYHLNLPARGAAAVGWAAPLTGDAGQPLSADPEVWLKRKQALVARAWRARLGQVSFTVPLAGRPVVNTLKTSLAYMLMSRDGPMLRPGTRSYDRSWIRDGSMISEALMRLGAADVAADYLRWYAPHQFADGRVPCCVDARGADPTSENDSDGELIFLAAEVYRYTGDKVLLRQMWPNVRAAANHLDTLRRAEQSSANQSPERRMLYGLVSPSISHEGYSNKPAYSYWDDFWALRGYQDAVFIAQALGIKGDQARLARARDEFRGDLHASLRASALAHGIDFIPGAADLGDFDATSTTIALSPGGDSQDLPKDLLDHTFERYWREFTQRRDGGGGWEAYTPYELRAIGVFVRLGRRDRADALLDFFLADRRPLAWNGWAEVVGREKRKPRFIGDMPHAWVASDYVRSVLDMFAFERESDAALVLGAGLPPSWFSRLGVGIRDLRTPYGLLTWAAKTRGRKLILLISGDARPPGGYLFAWPFAGDPGAAHIGGRRLNWNAGVLHLGGPGTVTIDLP
jgi:hypothetical protein